MNIEPLESRIAPASLTFTDVDGDKVVITTSGPGVLVLGGNVTVTNGKLEFLDLTDDAFQGANVSVVATRDPVMGGDGRVNVGNLSASGNDLGAVLVDGDLGLLTAGTGSDPARGVSSLTVGSLGRFGTDTGAIFVIVSVMGKLGSLKVQGDVVGTEIFATSIGTVTIGGSLLGGEDDDSGSITTTGRIGSVKITGDFVGGSGNATGVIRGGSTIGSVTVGGSLLGGSNPIVAADSGSGVIDAAGTLGPVKIGGDVRGGPSSFSGRIFSDVKITSVTVGGSLLGGGGFSGVIHSDGAIGAVKIGHDVAAATLDTGGEISAGTTLAGVTIGGSLRGGTGFDGGTISSFGDMGPVKIRGDVVGIGGRSGQIVSFGSIGSLMIGGSLIGGATEESGYISSSDSIGKITIGGNIAGGDGVRSGTLIIGDAIAGVSVGGSLLGGTGGVSGAILGDRFGPVRIGGDIVGGDAHGADSLDSSGSLQGDRLASLFVGGSLRAGVDDSTGTVVRSGSVRMRNDIGTITIKGSIVGTPHTDGNSADGDYTPAIISARGQAGLTPTAKTDLAIKSLSVGGRVELAQILAGYNTLNSPTGQNADAQIGKVVIGGDLIASSIVAGVTTPNPFFGSADDVKISGGKDNADAIGAISKIASVVIKGAVIGTPDTNDLPTFAIVAQQVGSLTLGGTKIPFKGGASNDLFSLNRKVGATRGATTDGFDFHAFEVA